MLFFAHRNNIYAMRYIKPFLENLENNDWQNTPEGLYKIFKFNNFNEAIDFIIKISKLVETNYPKIINQGNVVELWCDNILVEKIDSISSDNTALTKKEKLVLMLLKQGKSYKEITDELNSNYNTINFHIKNLYKKFNVNSVAQLLSKFI